MATTATRKKAQGKSTKKPKWTVVTYKKIEARRTELGYTKSAMAELLGVTNSTYHNWRRGTTVPHPNQQEQIKSVISKLPSVKATTKAKAAASKAKAKTKRGASGKRKRGVTGRLPRRLGDVGGGSNTMNKDYPASHPLYPSHPNSVPNIATITTAYINSQTKAPSAGSVLEFVRGLKDVLAD